MLRGLTTVNFFADDLSAARDWYTELLGIEPYFAREVQERPRISNSGSATTSTSWASSIVDSRRRAGPVRQGRE